MASQTFIPISLESYVRRHLASNPGVDRRELTERLRFALAAVREGAQCACGGEIWVIGSAEVGLSCFTCITGEATPSDDYEIDEALNARLARRRPQQPSRKPHGREAHEA